MKKKLFFKSRGVNIRGILSEPKKKSLNDFCMVFCHGLGSSKKSKKIEELSKKISKLGISSFAIDFYGHGESEGNLKNITTQIAAKNLGDAVLFLQKQGYRRFGVYGSSYGGSAAIIYASKNYPEFICLLAPRIKYSKSRLIEKIMQGYSKKFADDAQKTNLLQMSEKIKSPTLIVQGKKDNVCLPKYAKQFFNKMKTERMMVVFDNADHFFNKKRDFDNAVSSIYNFILYNLPKH